MNRELRFAADEEGKRSHDLGAGRNNKMDVLITGGTGFIGRQLVERLGGGWVVTRDAARAAKQAWPEGTQFIEWADQTRPLALPAGVLPQAVINLMGESVAGQRWTPAFKQRLRTSRIAGTEQLVAGLEQSECRPKVVISASAVGYYGDRGDERLTEKSAPGSDFLAQLAVDWEAATAPWRAAGSRVVNLRIGIVLGKRGGALEQMLPLFRWGLGGRLGSGKQWFPWIHEDDVLGLILWALEQNTIAGPVNAVSPGIVTNREFTQALARQLGRPAILPVPRFGLRLGLGEFADSLLASQKVVPEVALQGGYQFRFPTLAGALAELLG